MKQIENWKDVNKNEVVEFSNLEAGPQIVKILKVVDVVEKEYLKIAFDVSTGEFKDCFRDQFNRDDREDKKWPNSGIMYKSYKASASRFFAAFTTSVEKSNAGYEWDWKEQGLVGLIFVANFREEEYLYNDELKVSLKCYEPRSTVALQASRIKIMEKKVLPRQDNSKPAPKIEEPKGDFDKPVDDLPF